MGTEIERKFLVRDEGWRSHADAGTPYRQGYLVSTPNCTVRIRIAGERGFLTVKGATAGVTRSEFEYPVPLDDAARMLEDLCDGPAIDKIRYLVDEAGARWEVDVFVGANEGLVLAEIELAHENEVFSRPRWLGEEVSYDPRYFNAQLAQHPYRSWS